MSSIVDIVPTDPSDLRRLGARLRELRLAAGETQAQTAAALGMIRTYLSEIEGGRKNITLDTLFSLAQHFAVEPDTLLRVEVPLSEH